MLAFLARFGILLGYFVLCAASALILRRLVTMPKEIFRKTLHIILLGSILVLTHNFPTWQEAAAASFAFAAIVFPILTLLEHIPGYSELLTERKHGEIKNSLIVVFVMFTALICVCWGWLGEKYLVVASVLAWGLGDAAAALVGKRFGRHAIEGPLVEGRKSLEGTLAMFLVSFLTVLAILIVHRPMPWYGYAPISAITAAVCAVVELYTKNGMDTLTCPFAAAAVLIPLTHCVGVMG